MFRNEIGCSDPNACQKICQSESGCTDIAFVLLVLDLLPSGNNQENSNRKKAFSKRCLIG